MIYTDDSVKGFVLDSVREFLSTLDMFINEGEQVRDDFLEWDLEQIVKSATEETTAEDLVKDLVSHTENFELDSEITYLVYNSEIADFYDKNEDECEDALAESGSLVDHAAGCGSIFDLITRAVHAAQYARAYEAVYELREESENLEVYLTDAMFTAYGDEWNEED